MFTDFHSILAGLRNHFYQLLNIHGINNVRQTEIHTAKPLIPAPSAFKIEMAIEKLKSHKSSGIDQIPAEKIEEGDRKIRSEVHKLTNSIWDKEELPEEWKESFIVPICKKAYKTDCSNYRDITFANQVQNFIQNPAVKINSILNKEELPEEWKELIIVINYKKCDKTIIIEAYQFCQMLTKFY